MLTLTYVGTLEADWDVEIEIWSRGSAAQSVRGTISQGTGTQELVRRFGIFSRTTDMTSDRAIQIVVLLADAGDTVNIEMIELYMTL